MAVQCVVEGLPKTMLSSSALCKKAAKPTPTLLAGPGGKP